MIDKKTRRFIREFTRKLTRALKRSVVSIMLFGSVARGEATPQSDIDFLIVVDDNADLEGSKGKIKNIVARLERKHGFHREESTAEHLFSLLKHGQGGKTSLFMCSEGALRHGRIAEIFDINRLLAAFFIPGSYILRELKKEHKVLYGIDEFKYMRIYNTPLDLARSFLANFVIAFFGILALPLSLDSAEHLAMESSKNILVEAYQARNVLAPKNFKFACEYFIKKGICTEHVKLVMKQRKEELSKKEKSALVIGSLGFAFKAY